MFGARGSTCIFRFLCACVDLLCLSLDHFVLKVAPLLPFSSVSAQFLSQLSRRQEIDKEHLAKANQEREELRKKAAVERESSAKELEEVKKQKAEKLAEIDVRDCVSFF